LFDARLGRNPSGIGYYIMNLVEQFARLAPDDVRPICRYRQRRGLRRMGLSPVAQRGDITPESLPPAAVVHGANFHAPNVASAAQVATIHDLGFLHLPECHPPGMPDRLDALIRASEPRTALFLCDSEWTRQDFMSHYGVSEDRCRTVHLGVAKRYSQPRDPDQTARQLKSLRIRPPYLLHVGAMVPRKDLPTLLAAFALVAPQQPDLSLVLAGHKTRRWASDWEKIQAFLRDNPGLAARVRILDYARDVHLADLYAGAEACVSTSLMEGFGLTVLEGLASGRPVVATRGSAVSEIGEGVVHFGDAKQPVTYAEAILSALEQAPERTERGRQVAARFRWEHTAKLTLAAYRDAVLM
jgi:alpha-1,3-rhamnosyl/mannosyltransferase